MKLQVDALTARFGERNVVDGVSFSVSEGELWVVLGPNGAGKSTLLRAALGLHPVTSGTSTLLGRELSTWTRRALAREVAWVPQTFEDPGGFTVLELVLMGRTPHLGPFGLPGERDVQLARTALAELGLADLEARASTALSGGERRRVLLARAFAQEPKLVLLDEPTAFLDLKHQVEALRLLRKKCDGGLAAVVVLHDVNLAAAFADRVLLLKDGRTLRQGSVRESLDAEVLQSLYDVPMTAARAEEGAWLFSPRLARS